MLARNIRIAVALALSAGAAALATGSFDGHAGRSSDSALAGGNDASIIARPRTDVDQIALYRTRNATDQQTTISRAGPYGTRRALLVKRQAGERVQVYLPTRPNGSTAWAETSQLELSRIDERVVVDLERFRLRVLEGERVLREMPIAIGTAATPTPKGLFYVTDLIRPRDPAGAYGPYALGLSGRSDVIRSFAGSDGQLGIHGTNEPELIGQPISNGCVRLTNDNITLLARTVPLGTPVEIV